MLGLLKAAVEIIKLPVDATADVLNLGRIIDGKPSYTRKRCQRIMDRLDED
jgi:hypothetical protein